MSLAESTFVEDSSFGVVPFASDGSSVIQLPVLTSFIPSLFEQAPFRVSIHSWEKPKPSRMMDSLIGPGHVVLFQARVYVDGVRIADSIFDQRTIWPHVLDTSDQVDVAGDEVPLKFPRFHREILHQSHWEPGELLGRIRIVIAEGFPRDITAPHGKPSYLFDRFRDLVAFSFQHAPLHILEFSGIAWPNAGMWPRSSAQMINRSAPRGTKNVQPEDLHAHSPRRPSGWAKRAMLPPTTLTSDPTLARPGVITHPPATSGLHLTNDPFTDFRRTNTVFRHTKRSTVDDTPMPDYVSTSTERTRAYSDMTGLSYENDHDTNDTTMTKNGPSLGELIHKLSPQRVREILIRASTPSKDGDNGTEVPTNSPSSNSELPTEPTTTFQLPRLKAVADRSDRGAEQEVFPSSPSASRISPKLGENLLPRIARKDASPVSSIRGKKRATLDNEDMGKSSIASTEVKKSTCTSARVAVASMITPVVISNETNRPRSDSNGSKRKRSNPSSPMLDDGENDPCSHNKKASRETLDASIG